MFKTVRVRRNKRKESIPHTGASALIKIRKPREEGSNY